MTSDLCVLENEQLSVGVALMGAEMQYLRAAGKDLLWHGDAAYWTGRSPVLFPIVGRAAGDQVAVGDHSATLPQHGFARRNPFSLVEQSAHMCRHVLTETDATRAVYPFAFELHLTHRLDGPTLTVSAKVVNTSDQPMPFGLGFHPAFSWPLPGAGDQPHQVTLAKGGAPEMIQLEGDLLRRRPVPSAFADGTLTLNDQMFKDGALVFPNGSDTVRYGPADGPSLTLEFTNLPDLALWRPLGAPFLCIEPWHGTASYVGDGPQIADRPNSITLAPDAEAEFSFAVTVSV